MQRYFYALTVSFGVLYKLTKECWILLISSGWIPLKWHNAVIVINSRWDENITDSLVCHYIFSALGILVTFIHPGTLKCCSVIFIGPSLLILEISADMNTALVNTRPLPNHRSAEHHSIWRGFFLVKYFHSLLLPVPLFHSVVLED